MTRHVDAETLAGFRHGDLSPRRNARIRAHLAGCGRCRDLNEDLAGVTTLLAAAAPPPIPEHLAARIQTALATEAARRAGLTAAAQAGAPTPMPAAGQPDIAEPGAPELPRNGRPTRAERAGTGRYRPRRPWFSSPAALRTMAAAAAAVVVAGGAYEIVQHTGGSPATARSGAAHSQANAPAQGSAGLRARAPAFGPALTYQHAGQQDTINAISSGTDFTPTALRSQVASDLTQGRAVHAVPNRAAGSSGSSTGAPVAGPQAFGNRQVAVLQGCVNRIAAGRQVLLVDVARYRGAPATVIVTRPSPAGPEQVWVVGAGCSATRSDVLTRAALP